MVRSRKFAGSFFCVSAIVAVTLFSPAGRAQESKSAVPLQRPAVRQRVEDLLGKMTLEEKIGQLNQISAADFLAPANREEMITKGEIGSFLWTVDAERIEKYQHIAVEKSRLHIPLL